MIPHYTWCHNAHLPGTEPRDICSSIMRSRTVTSGGEFWRLHQVPKVLDRLRTAIRSQEPIAVHGDYDVDGVSSACIMAESITAEGGNIISLTASRRSEGYGFTSAAAQRLREKKPAVIVLTDVGTSAQNSIRGLTADGIDVICLDHHDPPEGLEWPGFALINPKVRGEQGQCECSCSATLAYYMACNLVDDMLPEFAELAALGILADMADISHRVNRDIVSYGLASLQRTTRPGLIWLLEQNNMRHVDLRGDDVAWTIIPTLNASGRIGDASDIIRALGIESEAADAAWKCYQDNQERKHLTAVAMDVAHTLLADTPGLSESPFPLLCSNEWNKGVIGLVASNICKRMNRPVGVGAIIDGEATLSFRCPPGHNVIELCSGIAELRHSGGHKHASGARANVEDLPIIQQALSSKVVDLIIEKPVITVERELPLGANNETSITVIDNTLAPYGQGWPRPLFVAKDLEVVSAGKMSKGQKVVLVEDGKMHVALSFERTDFSKHDTVDVVYSAEISHWRGEAEPKLIIKDARSTEL